VTNAPVQISHAKIPAPHRIRKLIKWIVYPILVLNLTYYYFADANMAQHTVDGAASTLLDWMSAFAATLDDLAWILLLFIYEVETYWLPWDFKNRFVSGAILVLKATFYAVIFHTSYTYIADYQNLLNAVLLPNNDLCAASADSVSYLRNLDYTTVTSENCSSIATSGDLYHIQGELVVTDSLGYADQQIYRLITIVENLSWLVILFLTEAAVQLQNRGWHEGPIFTWTIRVKDAAYLAIIGAALYWITKGLYVDAWDEFVWIGGFAVLDMNLSQWRDDLEESEEIEHESEDVAAASFVPRADGDVTNA